MGEYLFGSPAAWFTVPALIGSGVFLIRTGLLLAGGDDGIGPDADFDGDVDLDLDIDGADADVDVDVDADGSDSEQAFQFISIQSMFAFMMGFGWGGFAMLRGLGLGLGLSAVAGVGFGAGTVWLLAKIFKFVYGLQAQGNIRISQALELEGTVYVTVPAQGEGSGQVKVDIDDHVRYLRAVSVAGQIAPHTQVRVVDLEGDNTVVVRPVERIESGEGDSIS